MMTIYDRQVCLKGIGMYDGKLDGIEGKKTKAGYVLVQNKYFTRKKDRDGKYGQDTENLLISAYHCRDLKHFKLEEFKCKCGGKYCTGYPAKLDRNLVLKLDKTLRPKYGAIKIISGMRCQTWNRKQGGVSNSRHRFGKAVDFQCALSRKGTSYRRQIIAFCKKQFRYSYGNTSGMGASIHVDVN